MQPATTHPRLLAAKAVVSQIAGMGIASSNRDSSMLAHGEAEVERRFTALDAGMLAAVGRDVEVYHLMDAASIKEAARLVAHHQAGNCQEMAALAFDLLARAGHRPLELMSIREQDHVVVVIGRLAGTPTTPNAWNGDTVICDAWAKRAYFVHALADEMQTIRRVTNGETRMVQKFRLDTGAAY